MFRNKNKPLEPNKEFPVPKPPKLKPVLEEGSGADMDDNPAKTLAVCMNITLLIVICFTLFYIYQKISAPWGSICLIES